MRHYIRPFMARFGAKLATELAPAVLASLVGGVIASQWIAGEKTKPAMVTIQPAGREMLALLRDEHALLTELVKKDTETRLAANRAADADLEKLKAAADAAKLAQAKATEARSEQIRLEQARATAAARTKTVPSASGEFNGRKQATLTARQAESTDVRVAGEPLQLLDLQNADPARPRPPADLASYQPEPSRKQEDGFLKRQLRGAVAAVERVPSLLRGAADFLTGAASTEGLKIVPRIPDRNFLKVEM